MQKQFLKIAPYLVLFIVFTVACSLLFWDITISQSNIHVSAYVMREQGKSILRTFESNLITARIDSKEKFNELLSRFTEQENIEFIVLTNDKGKILLTSSSHLQGQTLPLSTPYTPENMSTEYINPEFPFDTDKIQNSKYLIVQLPLLHPNMLKMPMHGRHSLPPHEKNRMHRNMLIYEQLKQINLFENNQVLNGPLFLVVGFKTEEIIKAQLLDNKRTIMNLIGFVLLMLLAGLSFVLLKKYQHSYELIEKSKIYFDGLMNTIPLGILSINKQNIIVSCNLIAKHMLGSDDLKGKNICDFIPSIAFLDFSKPVVNTTVKTMHDQETNLELNSFNLIFDDNRIGIGIILRDLKEIQKLQEELNRKDRLASLGQLAAGIAHEIRNPLSSIKGFARIFEENAKDGSEEKMIAEIMNQEIQRVDKVISDLLEISKPNSLSMKNVLLSKVIEQAQNALMLKAKENNINFVNEIQIQEISLDHDRMIQVFMNIFINAIEASVKCSKEQTNILTRAWQEQDKAIIAIQDFGQGIAQSKLSQLFTPYFTTKAKGTGLGLVIVQKIIEAHKGSIRAESKENIGTTFYITLPLNNNTNI